MDENKRVAVFIDAENISASHAERIMAEASNYGDVIIKRIFADWSNPHTKEWRTKAPLLSLKTIQQFATVKGKNASDISLIVDVLTTLFESRIDVFCLVSGDSDFTSLAGELRERGKFVVGFGTKTAVPVYVNSFSEFIYLDKQHDKEIGIPNEYLVALREIINENIEHNGKALYANIGTEMKNKFKDFNPKNYGSLKDFIAKNLNLIGKYKIETEKDRLTMCLVPATIM